ncbi:hypothetical protein CR513_35371, partial [Mucuna pruriens]
MSVNILLRKGGPLSINEINSLNVVDLYEKWEMSNHLFVMFIKTKIFVGIQDSIDQHKKVRNHIHVIDKEFTTSDKSFVNTLIMQFSFMTHTRIRGMCDHIMCIRDAVTQLNGLEVVMLESFLIHYILCILSH